MKHLAVCAAVLLILAPAATADFFTEIWTNYDTGYALTSVSFSPVDNCVPIGESHNATLTTHCYSEVDGSALPAIPPKLPTGGLVSPWLGFFGGIQGSANGKYFGNLSQGDGDIVIWENLTATPTQVNSAMAFSRNIFVVGDRLYSVGAADGGPIEVLEPDMDGNYQVIYSTSGNPGGKADVAAKQDGSIMWGLEGLGTAEQNFVHQWSYDAGSDSYVYDGDIDYVGMGIGRSVGLGYDEDDGILFLLDFDNDMIHGVGLGSDAVGDEVLYGSWQADADLWYYGGVRVDGPANELYWGARNAVNTSSGDFGKLSYIPEPSSLGLLLLGGLALLRRR
jgi:hypothetical protein